jgi:hypothetical protein
LLLRVLLLLLLLWWRCPPSRRQPAWPWLLHCTWLLRDAMTWHVGHTHMLLLLHLGRWHSPHWLGRLLLLPLLWWRRTSHVLDPTWSHLLLLHRPRRPWTWPC